jgi:PAS domain S-box-containing protein
MTFEVFDLVPTPISIHDFSGRYLYANGKYLQIHGYESAEFLSRGLIGVTEPESAARIAARMEELREKGEISFKVGHVREDGSVLRLEIVSRVIEWNGEKVILGVATDVTERELAVEALRSSEEKLKSVFRAAPVGIGVVADRVIIEANAFLCDMVGYAREELVGSSSRLIYPSQEEFEFVGREKYRQIAERGIGTVETAWRRKDGQDIIVLLSSTPIYGMDLSRGVTFAAVDMTERSRLQSQLAQAQKMESVGRLAGGVAHDFNNMLGAIMGHAEMALEKLDRELDPRHNLEEILKASKRSADLTRQLLAFARKQTVSPVVLDPNEAIGGMLSMLKRLIGENIGLEWKPGPASWPVSLDPSQLDQILANLCVNARDAIPDTGTVTIETRNDTLDESYASIHPGSQSGEFLVISVKDDGKGMDKGVIEHLFEPFFTTKELGRGTGLGLATVYGIVKQNKGFIEVSSAPLRGTDFRIFLPRHAFPPAVRAAVPREAVMGRGETVLLVEDEKLLRDLGAEMLRSLGYATLVAPSPEEALAMARSGKLSLDLLVTDIVMPGMNGRELAEKFGSFFPRLACLYMSGYTADVIAHQGILEEGVHFIQKPFSIVDFSVKVRRALGK